LAIKDSLWLDASRKLSLDCHKMAVEARARAEAQRIGFFISEY